MAHNEAARQTAEPIVIADSPDVCLTPMGSSVVPVPYPIVARFTATVGVTSTVVFTQDPVFTTGSDIVGVQGDESGTLLGVASGSHAGGGYCHVMPMSHTPVVMTEGNLVVYHSSKMAMNCAAPHGPGNTVGTVIWQQTSGATSVDENGEVEGETDPAVTPETPQEEFARRPGETVHEYRERLEDPVRARPPRGSGPEGLANKVEELNTIEESIRTDPSFNAWNQNIDPALYRDPTSVPGVSHNPVLSGVANGDPGSMTTFLESADPYSFAGADGQAYSGDYHSVPRASSGIRGTLAGIESQRNRWLEALGAMPEGTYGLEEAVRDVKNSQDARSRMNNARRMGTLMRGGTTIDGSPIGPDGPGLATPSALDMF